MKLYSKKLVIMILITTIIIDLMAAGLIFPIMPSLFFDNVCVTFGHLGGDFQSWYYSIALSCWPLGLLIGCPIIGELSDKYGRKSILIIALISTFFAYLLSIYAIYSHSFIIFIASRFISGLAGGAFEIAQAAIIDISREEDKSKNIGFVTMAALLGFVVGPVITSLLSSVSIHYILPFTFAAVMAFINVILVTVMMKKDLPKNPGLIIQIGSIYKTISFLISDKRIRVVGIVYLLLQCGWGFYGQGVALFLVNTYNYSISGIGIFYALMGLSIVVASLVLQPKLFKNFSNFNVFVHAVIILGVGSMLVGTIDAQAGQWLLAIILSVCQLLCYTALLTMISSAVSSKEQGKAMGAAGAGFGLAWFLNDLMMGHLSSISSSTPITFGGGMFFVAVILFVFATKVMKEKVE